jgi:hypothetical protein
MTLKLFLILIGLLALALLSVPAVHLLQKALGASEEHDGSSRTEIIRKANPNTPPSPVRPEQLTSESFGSSSSSPTIGQETRNRHNSDISSAELNSEHITTETPSINTDDYNRLETQLHTTDTKTGMVIDAGGLSAPTETETEHQTTTDLIKELHLQRMQALETTMRLLSLTTMGQPLQLITN